MLELLLMLYILCHLFERCDSFCHCCCSRFYYCSCLSSCCGCYIGTSCWKNLSLSFARAVAVVSDSLVLFEYWK